MQFILSDKLIFFFNGNKKGGLLNEAAFCGMNQ